MDYAILALLAFSGGFICSLAALANRHREVAARRLNQESEARRLSEAKTLLDAKEQTLQRQAEEMRTSYGQWMRDAEAALNAKQMSLQHEAEQMAMSHAQRMHETDSAFNARKNQLDERAKSLEAAEAALNARAVSYKELADENSIIKRDLRNANQLANKLRFDVELQREAQEALDGKVAAIGSRYLKENVKWIGASLNSNNFVSCRQRLLAVIERCRAIGFSISAQEEAALVANLRDEYENVVRAAFEREEQARIKAQIREEQAREKAIEREIKQLEREREAIKAALEKAIAEAKDQHNEEVERLKARQGDCTITHFPTSTFSR